MLWNRAPDRHDRLAACESSCGNNGSGAPVYEDVGFPETDRVIIGGAPFDDSCWNTVETVDAGKIALSEMVPGIIGLVRPKRDPGGCIAARFPVATAEAKPGCADAARLPAMAGGLVSGSPAASPPEAASGGAGCAIPAQGRLRQRLVVANQIATRLSGSTRDDRFVGKEKTPAKRGRGFVCSHATGKTWRDSKGGLTPGSDDDLCGVT